jgi:catechol 2,3-dioxygenase-like lactoylglutathione lyase family enzyme
VIDHINLRVRDYGRSREFYRAALAPLGYRLAMEVDSGAGFAKGPIPSFWVKEGELISREGLEDVTASGGCGGPQIHVAFGAATRAVVDEFHRAALTAGGRDNGSPGLRPMYHANYYGAFVLDPDGYNIEAVCHSAE